MDDPADHPAVIDPGNTANLVRQQRPKAPAAPGCITIGHVWGVYRVSVLWKSHHKGEKLGGDFATHAEAVMCAEGNVTVRTIRPHDTVDGMKNPGDKYERTEADAKKLEQGGTVEIVKSKPVAKAKG